MKKIGDITWYRGDSFPIELTLTNKETEDPIPLNGYSFLFTVNAVENPEDDSEQIFQVIGVLDADPTTGKVSFTPTTTDTDLSVDIYYYDIQMTDGSGNIRTIAKHKFKITMDITKA